MTGGLTLSLKPREKFLVGGCLVENGPKRSSIRVVDDNVFVLRLTDALHPDEVCTPVTRAYHVAQMILACEVSEDAVRDDLVERLEVLETIFSQTPEAEAIKSAVAAAHARRYHGVINALKQLRRLEAAMLGPMSGKKPEAAEADSAPVVQKAATSR